MNNLFNLLSDGSNFFGDDFDFEELLVDVEVDKIFERSLQEETITVEELLENAPWNRMEGESDEAYELFIYFCNLDITEWKPEEIVRFVDTDDIDVFGLSKRYNWKSRRLSFLKYQEWIRRKKAEIDHLDSIAEFRDNQADLLKKSGKATIDLIGKLALRIEALDPEEIKAADIPKFISSVSTFITMSSDAEARFNAINELLALYESDIDSNAIRKHILLVEGRRKGD